MNAKHTPGPWLQYADTNIVICKWRGPGAESLRVCEVSTNTRGDEGRHNLNLIAAAPDMLTALVIAREFISTDRNSLADTSMRPDGSMEQDDESALVDYDDALLQIDAAIAKATGAVS